MANIGIYGGSFNPPHKGHMLAAVQCRAALGLERVIVVPAAVPPHKALADGSPDAQTRLALTRLAVEGLDSFEVSDMELRRDGPSYTVDTLRELAARFSGDTLYLMMGTDMFLSFSDWRAPGQIAQLAKIVCFARAAVDAALKERLEAQAALLQAEFGADVTLLHNEFLDLSSTAARRLLFWGLADEALAPQVLHFIQERGLYGLGQSYRALPFDALKAVSLSLHKSTRRAHAVGTSETAAALARRYGADETLAARAGILHDVTKALTDAEQLAFCRLRGLPVSDEERGSPGILHGKTAAWAAREIFGECAAACSAIEFHTTGRADMTLLEKIIYIADYVEPTRSFPGVDMLRSTVWRDLDEGVLLGLTQTMQLLQTQGRPVCSASARAREYLLRERKSL